MNKNSEALSGRPAVENLSSPMPSVTMAEIAKKLQVDQSTVSLALRNSSRISAATRERIQKAALALGYKPNPFVSALMRMRRGRAKSAAEPVVAWVSNWDQADFWMQVPYFRSVFHGAAERLRETGFRLEPFWMDPNSSNPARLSAILWNRGISGMILAPVPNNRPDATMDWEKFSAVTIGRSIHSPDLDRVDSAHYDSITVALKRCRELGYGRIGLAIDEVSLARFDQRFRASYLVNNPPTDSGEPLEIFRMSVESKAGVRAFQDWFRSQRPDVIITLAKNIAEMQTTALLDLKIRVPQDVGLVILSCHSADDPYTGIYQFPELIGAQAADLLVRKMLRTERGIPKHPLTFTINGTWNPGTTTRRQSSVPAENPVLPGPSQPKRTRRSQGKGRTGRAPKVGIR